MFVSLPVGHDPIKHPIPLGLSSFVCVLPIFCCTQSFFLIHCLSVPEPRSAALLVTLLLPGLTAQIQMDYCKPVNLSVCGAVVTGDSQRAHACVSTAAQNKVSQSKSMCLHEAGHTACGQVTLNLHLIQRRAEILQSTAL